MNRSALKNLLKKPEKAQQIELSDDDRATIQKLEILVQAVERVYPSMKGLMWRSFVQGIFVGLGTTVGLTIVFGTLTYALTQLKVVPGLGELIEKSKVERIIPRKDPNPQRF